MVNYPTRHSERKAGSYFTLQHSKLNQHFKQEVGIGVVGEEEKQDYGNYDESRGSALKK